MNRMALGLAAVLSCGVLGCGLSSSDAETTQDDKPQTTPQVASEATDKAASKAPPKVQKLVLTEAQWKEKLSPEQFRILREKGTEQAFTGTYWDHKEDGVYLCAGCEHPLFDSKTKFKSGTGWPSYWQPIGPAALRTTRDFNFGWIRTELLCAKCDGHLGHVFDDGPKPTGMRYCINSAALKFRPAATSQNKTSAESKKSAP